MIALVCIRFVIVCGRFVLSLLVLVYETFGFLFVGVNHLAFKCLFLSIALFCVHDVASFFLEKCRMFESGL